MTSKAQVETEFDIEEKFEIIPIVVIVKPIIDSLLFWHSNNVMVTESLVLTSERKPQRKSHTKTAAVSCQKSSFVLRVVIDIQ